jgi:hypothetical protein
MPTWLLALTVSIQLSWRDFKAWFKRELKHGENIPVGFGWAGYNELTERVYVLPIGINYLWTIGTYLYHGVWKGLQSREQSYTYKTGLQLGTFSGYKQGYMHGYTDAKNGIPNKLYARDGGIDVATPTPIS